MNIAEFSSDFFLKRGHVVDYPYNYAIDTKSIISSSYEAKIMHFIQDAVPLINLTNVYNFRGQNLYYICSNCSNDIKEWNYVMIDFFSVWGAGYDLSNSYLSV